MPHVDDKIFDGNAEQVRAIAKQLAMEFANATPQPQHDPDFIAWMDKYVSDRIKLWVGGVLIVQLIPLLVIAFTLGGMNASIANSLGDVSVNANILEKRGQWMQRQERFKADIVGWAKQDPDRPYRGSGDEPPDYSAMNDGR